MDDNVAVSSLLWRVRCSWLNRSSFSASELASCRGKHTLVVKMKTRGILQVPRRSIGPWTMGDAPPEPRCTGEWEDKMVMIRWWWYPAGLTQICLSISYVLDCRYKLFEAAADRFRMVHAYILLDPRLDTIEIVLLSLDSYKELCYKIEMRIIKAYRALCDAPQQHLSG